MKHWARAGLALAVLAASGRSGPAGEGAGPRTYYLRTARGTIRYSVADRGAGGSGTAAVEVWRRRDGGPWIKHGVDRKLDTGRMLFEPAEEGTYDFVTVAVDAAGNRELLPGPGTQPRFRVVVDRTAPEIVAQQEEPATEPLADAGMVEFSWAARDRYLDALPVTVQTRLAGERDWQTVEAVDPETGKTAPLALPAGGLQIVPELDAVAARVGHGEMEVRFAVRDLAGNRAWAPAGRLRLDRLAPVGRVTGPNLAGGLDVEVTYQVEDRGPAGVKSVAVWLSADDGRSWQKRAEKPAVKTGPARVRLPAAGRYGLYLTACDKAGNRTPDPESGTKPQLVLLADATAPRLELVARDRLEGRAFSSRRGAEQIRVSWRVFDDNLKAGPITVEFSPDGGESWSVVARNLDNDPPATPARPAREGLAGSHSFTPPAVDSSRCMVRVTAEDTIGNRTTVSSQLFSVDNRAPKSSFEGFEPAEEPEEDEAGAARPLPEVAGPATTEPPAPPPPPAPDARGLLAAAQELLERGANAAAAARAAEALRLKPGWGPAHLLAGRAILPTDPVAALPHLEKADELVPDSPGLEADLADACFEVGKRCMVQNRLREARRLLVRATAGYDRVLAIGKESAVDRYNLGQALAYRARLEDDPLGTRTLAEVELRRALEGAGDDTNLKANCRWWLGELREEARDFRAAVTHFTAAAELYGRDTALGRRALARAAAARRRR
jgi:hypothetical protein